MYLSIRMKSCQKKLSVSLVQQYDIQIEKIYVTDAKKNNNSNYLNVKVEKYVTFMYKHCYKFNPLFDGFKLLQIQSVI